MSAILLLLLPTSALNLGAPVVTRRSALVGAALAGLPASSWAAAKLDAKAVAEVNAQRAALKSLVDNKESFIQGLAAGDAAAPQLPAAVPFRTFQKLEEALGPDFMEAGVDYAEASRNARDLVKLAQLSKSSVEVSSKEKGKPRTTEIKEYGETEGSALGSAKSYAERAAAEVLGASLAIEAAAKAGGL